MKNLRIKKLKGGKFNKRICWKNTEGKDRRVDFEKMPFFYIIPKLGFRCENKKLQYIIFGWLFWEISFYRDVYNNQISTEDEKHNLLRKDLCARLPYHPRVKIWIKDGTTEEGILDLEHNYGDVLRDILYYNKIVKIKPYLRSISSMTEKEVNKLFDILNINEENETEWLKVNDINIIRLFTQEGKDFYEIAEAIDYLYSIHVDFKGLIEKGLAIDATGLNIY